jgi:hypothetical protein
VRPGNDVAATGRERGQGPDGSRADDEGCEQGFENRLFL